MTTEAKTPDILAMSDEDFLKLPSPPAVAEGDGSGSGEQTAEEKAAAEAAAAEEAQRVANEAAAAEAANAAGNGGEGELTKEQKAAKAAEDAAKAEADQKAADEAAGKPPAEGATLPKDKSQEKGKTATQVDQQTPADKAKAAAGKESKEAANAAPGSTTEGAQTPPDYKALYTQIMAPLKANGKTIDLKTPEEAIQLMQMGANYTRKMQSIAPHRKVLMMLENNGLLDEAKLSFLIDLDKKNPEAIKKLIKDAGVDPLEIDTDTEPAYKGGNHRVSDEEATFVAALEDLRSTPGGTETLQTINTHWDQASKDVLWKSPELMAVINEQRENGVYTKITAEVDRRKTLGTLPAHIPFLQAYKAVGDELSTQGAFNPPAKAATPAVQVQQPLATRVAQPKPAANAGKVAAAAATRTTPQKTQTLVNPLAMSDDDFLKQMQNRL